jgi:hypothetical protein
MIFLDLRESFSPSPDGSRTVRNSKSFPSIPVRVATIPTHICARRVEPTGHVAFAFPGLR